MEATGHTIPLQREPLRKMRPRFKEALRGTYNPNTEDFIPEEERTKSDIRRHLFDFMDGMRMHVSTHDSELGKVIHAYAQWFEKKAQPNTREDGVAVVIKRMQRLLEALDHIDEPPEPIEAGVNETGVPHVFFEYPSPAFK